MGGPKWGQPSPTACGKAARLPPLLQLCKGQNHPTRKLTSCTPCSQAQRAPFKCICSYAQT